jgi:HD-GYP domain-containing protein (c-di-GMP phosphodiesterase class II)
VADIFEALTAARPYREGMPVEKACQMLKDDAGVAVCGESVEALEAWLGRRDYTSRIDAQLESVDRLVSEL